MPIHRYLVEAKKRLARPCLTVTSVLILMQLTRILGELKRGRRAPSPGPHVDDHSRWSITTLHLHLHPPTQQQEQVHVPAWPDRHPADSLEQPPGISDPFGEDTSESRVETVSSDSPVGSVRGQGESSPREPHIGISHDNFDWYPGQPSSSQRPYSRGDESSARLSEPWRPDQGLT